MSGIPVEAGRSETRSENLCVFPKAQACGAKTRSGTSCKLPAERNPNTGLRKRCRLHGGLCSGPRNPTVKHGRYSRAYKEAQRVIQEKLEALREKAASMQDRVYESL
jgi:hypothetical protein